jgi:3-hydroxyacyl-[acyl-carrier-protein] dehydratase
LNIKKEIGKYMMDFESPADGILTARFTFPEEFVGFQGHFPSEKILPGVCQIQCISSMIEKYSGKPFLIKEIVSAKYLSPVLPSEEIVCRCSLLEDAHEELVVKASVNRAGQAVAELKLRGLVRGKS